MLLLQRVCKTLGLAGLVFASPTLSFADTAAYAPQGTEFAPIGALAGDQVNPFLALNSSGGYLVWQDNITDGSGLGISAVKLNGNFGSPYGVFRINQQGTNDQENPQVTLLQNGGAAFVWQSGLSGSQHIYARFLAANGTFTTGDVMVNTATNHHQINPAIVTLANSNVVVTWSSFGQDNADGMQGVYSQILTPAGAKVGVETQVNQFTPYNQRTPAIAVFPNGNYVITWVSEQQTHTLSAINETNGTSGVTHPSVDIFARVFSPSGTPVSDEFLVSGGQNACANPQVATASDGSFTIVWSQKDTVVPNNSWDIYGRSFVSVGNGGAIRLINTQQYGDQYAPKISSIGAEYLVVWTSLGQDGSREGVFGQLLHPDASPNAGEFMVNTTVLNQQMFQTVASDGSQRFMVGWSSFGPSPYGMDIRAQAYASTEAVLTAPAAPFVAAVDSTTLTVTWPVEAGLSIADYEVYVDGSSSAQVVTNNMWSATNFAAGSTHTFKLAYLLTDGRQSPVSVAAAGTTWGADRNADGLPDNWQSLYWGANSANWPAPGTVLEPNGPNGPKATVLQVFLWGANPTEPTTWLTTTITSTSEGIFLGWNTIAGSIYQVQTENGLNTGNWTAFGQPRIAAGTTDSIYLGMGGTPSNPAVLPYRIVRFRY